MDYIDIERKDTGPAHFDKTAMTEEQELFEREYMARQEEIAIADLYANPALRAIRAIPAEKWNVEVVRQILTCINSKVIQSAWSETHAGDEIICFLTDLDANLGAQQ